MRRLTSILTLAVVTAPAVVTADIFRPSVKDQIALGKKASDQVKKEETVLPSTDPRVKLVKRLGAEILAQIPTAERDKKPFEYNFEVIESKEVNAFALPGGPMYLYTGLLSSLKTEDQVMGVIAHEITHVRKEHWASAYADNQKRRLGITLALVLLNANSTAFDIASVSDTLLFTLPYSRKHETQADTVGYSMMVGAGYNPQGMVDVFKVLKEKGGSKRTTEWLSSHPDSDRRISNIQKRISAETRTFPEQKPLSRSVIGRNTLSEARRAPELL